MSEHTSATLVDAIVSDAVVTIIYVNANGIMQVRAIRPTAIVRCTNGNTVVKATCVHKNAPRQFTLRDVLSAARGNEVSQRIGFLRDNPDFASE